MEFLKPDGSFLMVEDVERAVRKLVADGAFHKRRGFSLRGVPASVITNHMLEEAVELQAECLIGCRRQQIKEAADLLGAFLHLLQAFGITLQEVSQQTLDNLRQNFTTNRADVQTESPGYLRSNRTGG